MKLAIFTYDHRHGTDICVHAVPDDWTSVRAEKYARQELEAEYGKEDIAIETEKYGGVEFNRFLDETQKVFFNDEKDLTHTYKVQLVGVPSDSMADVLKEQIRQTAKGRYEDMVTETLDVLIAETAPDKTFHQVLEGQLAYLEQLGGLALLNDAYNCILGLPRAQGDDAKTPL